MSGIRLARITVMAVVTVALAVTVSAVTVAPVPSTVAQPDGTPLTVTPVGDEFNQFWELPGGYTVMRDSAGWWRVARLDGSGRLVPGEVAGSAAHALDVRSLPAHLRPRVTGGGPGELAPIAPGSRSLQARALSTGVTRQPLLVILVEFTDRAPLAASASDFQQAFFGSGRSVAQYYHDTSFGKVEMVPANDSQGAPGDGVVGWLKLSMPHPNRAIANSKDSSVTQQQKDQAGHNMRLAVKAAIEAANPYVDFAAYDTNHDGAISRDELAVVVITAGWEASFGGYKTAYSPANWGHRWSLGWADSIGMVAAPVVDGVTVADEAAGGGYSSFGEWMQSNVNNGHRSTIGVMAHELGHDTLGLPDLYDTDYSSQGVGAWDLMGSGSWGADPSVSPDLGSVPVPFSAWSKLTTNMVRPTDLQGAGTLLAPPAALNPAMYRVGSGLDNEYFLLEYRAPVGWDAGLKRFDPSSFAAGGGLAIWHVDEAVDDNTDEAHRKVSLVEANGGDALEHPDGAEAARSMVYFSGGVTRFADDTAPNAHRYDGVASAVAVSGVGAAGVAGISFDYQAPNDVGFQADECANALDVELAPGQSRPLAESLWQATGGDTPTLCTQISHTGWYRVVPARTGKLTVSTSGFDTVAAVLAGSCGSFTVLGCDDDISDTNKGSLVGGVAVRRDQSVYVVVGAWGDVAYSVGQLGGSIALASADALTITTGQPSGCPAVTLALSVKDTGGAGVDGISADNVHAFLDGAEVAVQQFAGTGSGGYTLGFTSSTLGTGAHTLRLELDTATAAGDASVNVACPGRVRQRLRRSL